LLWTFDMAAMGQSMTNHLAATLFQVSEGDLGGE
jgi:hypothetical protein